MGDLKATLKGEIVFFCFEQLLKRVVRGDKDPFGTDFT